MTTRLVVDDAVVKQLSGAPEIKQAMTKLAREVLENAQQNLRSMDAVESGALLNSGFVDQDNDGSARIGFDVEYAAIVHEGDGSSGRKGPRPYLAAAAARNYGILQ